MSYGYGRKVSGPGYEFSVDPGMDSWLCENGDLMPIATSVLEDCDEGPIEFTSFTILSNGRVQVNVRLPDEYQEYHVYFYPIEALSFVGDSYSVNE